MKNIVFLIACFLIMETSCSGQQNLAQATVDPAEKVSQKLPPGNDIATSPSMEPKAKPVVGSTANGTIRGRVVYKGGHVHNVMNVIKDEGTCGAGEQIDESLLSSEDGGLEWAVVSIVSDIQGGKSLDQLPGDRSLNQHSCTYVPHVVLVGVGQALAINNMDHTLHNVRTVSFMNDVVNKVQIYMPNMPAPSDTVYYKEPEVVEVVCDVHGWMKAYVHVVENAYNIVTDSDGNFKLTDVPPGHYTLKAWHEKLGEIKLDTEVKAGETSELNFTYQELKN